MLAQGAKFQNQASFAIDALALGRRLGLDGTVTAISKNVQTC